VQKLFPLAVGSLDLSDDNDMEEQEEVMTIDLTQLFYTQMAVIQDLEGRLDNMIDRIARLEKRESESEPSGPLEAMQKMAEGLMAP